ncbi:TNF receptor-associated factor 6-like isoform X2 [Palaemon carinicauda]
MQTTCGHRFCKDCIFNCLSESCSRCPVDNTPLLESDLFADSCAEREILQLKVKCPNNALGCQTIVDLMYIEHHTQACSFQPVMCPNECLATVLQKELEQHLSSQCILRVTRCELCDQPFTFNQEQLHLLSCSRVTVTCEMCGAMMSRGEVPSHTTEYCPKVVVACTFAEHGCHHKMTRSDLDQHMEQATQYHLLLLSSAYKKINAFASDLSRQVGLIQSPSGNFSRQPSLRSQMSATSPIHENHVSSSQHDRYLEKSFGAFGGSVIHNDKSSLTPHSDELGNEINKLELQLDNLNASETAKCGFKIPNSISHQEIILRDVSEKTVDLNQRMLEETIKLSNLTKRIEEVDSMVEVQMADVSGKFCNGEYVWKINNFSPLCTELQNKAGRVLHSPPFYTSQFGYKFCLRINVTWKSNEHFLAIFIHAMQGENDDFLDWPFSGQINLSILDCGPSLKKNHIIESMVSKPDLQAFQRPVVSRNPKGFGFTEFVPLAKLLKSEGGSYINRDVLCIRAVVSPKLPNATS